MAAGAEIELKFLFAERDSTKIKTLISAASSAKQQAQQRLHAIYFDTPNCELWMHGFILRVRANGKSHIQTVKQMMPSSIHPGEWEAETGTLVPNLELIKGTPLSHLAAKPSIRGALRTAFEVNVERTSYLIETGGGVIEASLDKGAIEANGEKLGVRELELELKSGNRRALYNLARAFISQAPLHPSLISKAERGHLLAKGTWGRAAKGSKPRLRKDMTCGQAFQEIGRTCLHDFHLNLLGVEKLDNEEAVHQARVALRRLRASLALFKPMVFDITYRKILSELKWLAGLLGAARDLDVLQANLPRLAAWSTADTRARELASHCEAERLRARQCAVESLNSERGRILLLDLAVWLEDGQWLRQASSVAGEPLQGFVNRRLKKRLKKFIRAGAGLAHLAPGPRHKVRIEAKELRYMAELFVDVPAVAKDRKRLNKLIDCCEKLQGALGLIRDQEAVAQFMESEDWGSVEAAGGDPNPAISATSEPPQAAGGTEKQLKKAVRAFLQVAANDAF